MCEMLTLRIKNTHKERLRYIVYLVLDFPIHGIETCRIKVPFQELHDYEYGVGGITINNSYL